MSLALVQVPATDFHQLHQHLMNHMPRYRNMHMREAHTRRGRRTMRQLHAMVATTNAEIEGMISGPGVFWHYRLKIARGATQMQVLAQRCSSQEDARLGQRFLNSVQARMREEQARSPNARPKYLQGEFYLRRSPVGIAPHHPHCHAAMTSGALDPRFVSQLQHWNLTLLRP